MLLLVVSAPDAVAGTVTVKVFQANQPIGGAVVCVGTAGLLNEFGQGTTDALGAVVFTNVPNEPFVVTAHRGTSGAQLRQATNATGFAPSLGLVRLDLPASGGPRCPDAAPQPLGRPAVPRDFVLPTRVVPTSIVIDTRKPQHCFGALGAECGLLPTLGLPVTALCSLGTCSINAGSWEHDECCWDHPRGMACQVGPLDSLTGHDGNCVVTWNKALDRLGRSLSWQRSIDFNRENRTGTVVFAAYCAPAGTRIDRADAQFCCSRSAHAPPPAQSKFADTSVMICD